MLTQLTLAQDRYFKIGAEKAILMLFSQNPEAKNNTINFTRLLQKINTNGTYLKREMLDIPQIFFNFSIGNEKFTSPLLETVEFHDKNNMTWMNYSVPDSVLKLLSRVNFNIEHIKFENIRSAYTLRFFSMLCSHHPNKMELTKCQLFDIFKLPNSYRNKTNLIRKFLTPIQRELKEAMDIDMLFEFFPEKPYERIIFSIEVPEEPEVELENPMDILLYDMFLKFKEEEKETILTLANEIYKEENEQKSFEKCMKLYIVKALKRKNGM